MKKEGVEKIIYAKSQLIPELIDLWITAFGDSRDYVEFYFSNRFREENMLIYLIDEKPVSMISMLPAVLHTDRKKQDIRYIYAVATAPAYRRRGYAKTLIQEGQRRLRVPFVLEPASEQLKAYYKEMGFRESFHVNEEELLLSAVQAAEIKKKPRYWLLTATPMEYKKIRDEKLSGEGFVEWDKDAISYVLRENEFCGGYAYKVYHVDSPTHQGSAENDETEDILLYRQEDGCLKIIETTLKDEDILRIIDKLQLNPEQICVRRPVTGEMESPPHQGSAENSKKRTLGMILGGEDIKDGYLNLTLE